MNGFDIVILVLLLIGCIRGFLKGLFVEVASLVALFLGIYCSIHFSYFIGDWLKNVVEWDKKYITLTAFASTFIVIIIVIALLGKILTKIADFAALGFLNKILGGVFGTLKIGLILSIIFIFFGKINESIGFIKKETLDESVLYAPIKRIGSTIFPSIIKESEITKDANDI